MIYCVVFANKPTTRSNNIEIVDESKEEQHITVGLSQEPTGSKTNNNTHSNQKQPASKRSKKSKIEELRASNTSIMDFFKPTGT